MKPTDASTEGSDLQGLKETVLADLARQPTPFAWYRILKTGVVVVAGESPPKGDIWCPLYRAPIHNEHPDTARLRWVCDGMDGFGDRDFHAEACKLAGGAEPDGTHYMMAYRAIIDTMCHTIERTVPYRGS